MRLSRLTIVAPQLQLSYRRRIERIVREAIAIGDRMKLLESSFGAVALADGDRAIEGNDRRGVNVHQPVVQRHDRLPVSLLYISGTNMMWALGVPAPISHGLPFAGLSESPVLFAVANGT
jgi:hypothetical protein